MSSLRTAVIDAADDSTFRLQVNRSYQFISQIPERKQDVRSFGTWLCPATDIFVDIVSQNTDEIRFESEYAETMFKSIQLRTAMSEKIREQTAAYKDSKVVPFGAEKLIFDERTSGYQRLASLNSHLSDGYALFMEQGTGKTLATIARMCNLPVESKALVLCPNNVRLNWVKELQKFATVPTKINVLRGWQLDRVSQLIRTVKKTGEHLSVAISGYDSLAGMWEAMQMIHWDLVVLDESHYVKNSFTKRWKYVSRLRDRSDRRMVLTGTPIANSIIDLYTQLEFLGKGYSGFSSYKAFKKFYGVYKRDEDNHERMIGLQNVPHMKERLSRYSFIITKKEALPDLPEKVYDIDEVEMTKDQAAAYDKLQGELAFEIENEINTAENQALVVNNILTMLLKLAQITSGYINIPEERDCDGGLVHARKTVHFVPNPKIDRLVEILKDKTPTEKTIIWCSSPVDIEKISRALDVHGIKNVTYHGGTSDKNRTIAEDTFNEDDSCKVFIGNPSCGGTGLNLLGYPPGFPEKSECNADHVIFFSQDWSSLKRSQAEDRAHRRGTRTNIRVTDLCVPNTIDESIRARVVEKRVMAFEITDLREILREVINRE